MKRLDGKVILLAGGAGGIGSATAERLAAEGAAVVVGDLDAEAAASVANRVIEAGGRAVAIGLDIGDLASVREFVAFGVQEFGGADGLFANAAFFGNQDLDTDALDIDLAVWEQLLHVDLTGYLYCTRQVLPHLLARGGGAIVYTSSGAAYRGLPRRVAYSVAKSGVQALMRHVAARWGKEGIRANAIAPGLVESPTVMGFPQTYRDRVLRSLPSPRLGECADIAAMVALLMSKDGNWMQGQVISINGGSVFRD